MSLHELPTDAMIHFKRTLRFGTFSALNLVLSVWVLLAAGEFSRAAQSSALFPGQEAAAANGATGAGASEVSTNTLQARLEEARANLAAAVAVEGATNAPAGVSPHDLVLRQVMLRRLVGLYEEHLDKAAELESAKIRKGEVSREAQAWTRFTEPLPYSVFLGDRLREDAHAERLRIRDGEAAAATLEQLIQNNREALAQAEEKIRRFNEQLENTKEPALTTGLAWQRELERLRSQVASATVAALDAERLVLRENLEANRIHLGLFQRQLVIAEAGASFTQTDLDQVVLRLKREREQLERELADVQAQRVSSLKAMDAAREELRLAETRTNATSAVRIRAAEWVAVRQAQLDSTAAAASVLRLLLEGINVELAMWEMRYAAYGSRSVATLRESARRLEDFARRLNLWRNYARQQLDASSSQSQLQETRFKSLPVDSDLRPLARELLDALRESDRMQLRFARSLERLQRLVERWDEGLRAAQGRLPFAGRVSNLFSDGRSFLQRLWNFEVFTAEDTIVVDGQKITGKRSVTIGKIVMAVFILVAGVWITGLVTRFLEPIIIRRLKIEPNQASLIRRWLRAVMVVCLVLFSLVSVKIPLTIFAFAGGALAIGLGFGTQTMLKNLVSGIIILFERPFRVGDVLDVGGQRGSVTSVGLRASILELWDGTETLIPNSTLLENNLTNWTYSNRKVRFAVTVGVAYGSDPRRVIQLLGEVAERHGLVQTEPKPQVLFTEFADSTLNFELRFWLDVSKANAAQVSSDLRLMIAGSFAEAGITIAFPQRDIHLQIARPLPVQVMPMGKADVGAPEPAAKPEPSNKIEPTS